MHDYFAERGKLWALWPDAAASLARDAALYARNPKLPKRWTFDAAQVGGRDRGDFAMVDGKIAVVALLGPMLQRPGFIDSLMGATSTERLGHTIDALARDKAVTGILLWVDSPGGEVSGLPEFADKVRSAAQRKPVVALANSFMASAAYWAGSQAREVVAVPSAEVGSIGVIAVHQNLSGMLDKAGIQLTVMTSTGAPRKAEGNPFQALTDVARAEEQGKLDAWHDKFVGAISRSRGKVDTGAGLMFMAEQAQRRHLIERIATVEQVLGDMVSGTRSARNPAAHVRERQLVAAAPRGVTPPEVAMARVRAIEVTNRELGIKPAPRVAVCCYAAVFGRPFTSTNGKLTTFQPGAFYTAGSIPALWGHQTGRTYARSPDTLDLHDDGFGLRVTAWLPEDSDLVSALASGPLAFGMSPSARHDGGTVTCSELTEVSFAPLANCSSRVTAAFLAKDAGFVEKRLAREQSDTRRSALARLVRHARTLPSRK